jgi:hypothetical protein
MFMTRVKLTVLGVLAAGVLGGGGLAGYNALNAEPPPVQKVEELQPKERPKANDLEERRAAIELRRKLQPLMEKRLAGVKLQMQSRAEELLAGKTTVDVLLEASRNLLKAQQEMSDRPVDQLRMLEMHFERMKLFHEIVDTRFRAGRANTGEVGQAAYERYDAEIALERYKAKLGNDKPKGEVTKALFEGTEVNPQP